MGIRFGDILDNNPNFFYFPILLADKNVVLEKTEFKYGETTTALLNYDLKNYKKKIDLLTQVYQIEDAEKYKKISQELKQLIENMPFYSSFKGMHSKLNYFDLWHFHSDDNDNPYIYYEDYLLVLDDIVTIKKEYAGFLSDMHYREVASTKSSNYYAIQIEENGLSYATRSTSLANSAQPTKDIEIQYEVRVADKEPLLDDFTEEDTQNLEIYEKLFVKRLIDFVYIDFFRGLQKSNSPKQCKHCGQWFLQESGVQYEYADHIAPNERERTCREVGATLSFQDKVKNNPIWQIHNRAYKKYYARYSKKKLTQAQFSKWTVMAEKARDKALDEYEKNSEDFVLEEYAEKLNKL